MWLYDFATKSARPLTADNVGSLEPSFDWQGRRTVDRSALPRRLLPDSVILRPWYSSDGKFIYFTFANLQFKEEQIRIWRIPAHGGAMEPITPEGLPNSQGLLWILTASIFGSIRTGCPIDSDSKREHPCERCRRALPTLAM